MELRRAGKKSSWGGGQGGASPAGVTGEADGFKVGHFGCGVGLSSRINCSLKVSDAVGWKSGLAFVETTIWLKTDRTVIRCAACGQNSNGNIGRLWQGRNRVWK